MEPAGKWKLSIGPREGQIIVTLNDVDRTIEELEILGLDPSAYVRRRWSLITTITNCRITDHVDPTVSLRSIECALIRALLAAPELRYEVFNGIERAVLARLRGDNVDAITLQPVT